MGSVIVYCLCSQALAPCGLKESQLGENDV